MKKSGSFSRYLLAVVAVFVSSFANADWYVKDKTLIAAVNTMAGAKTLADVTTAVSNVQTAVENVQKGVGDGKETDNLNSKLKTVNENITELTNEFKFKDKTFSTFNKSEYLSQFKTPTLKISAGIKTESPFSVPKVNCGSLDLEDKTKDNGVDFTKFGASLVTFYAAAKATLTSVSSSIESVSGLLKAGEENNAIKEACKNINFLVAEMYEETFSFNKQINDLQIKINGYKNILDPSRRATSSSTTTNQPNTTKSDSYADIAVLSLELQIIQASQANIIGVHASNVAMFKFQIQAAKEAYLKLAIKRMLG